MKKNKKKIKNKAKMRGKKGKKIKKAKISKKILDKRAPKTSKEIVKEEDILKLIEKGRHRGFVTESEVMHAFPFIEKDIEGLEKLYERLEASNISIIETGKVFEQERAKEHEEKKKLETELGDISSDSVQMYLREIGQHPLLRAEEEVDLAKKILVGDEAARQKLILSNLRLVVSI